MGDVYDDAVFVHLRDRVVSEGLQAHHVLRKISAVGIAHAILVVPDEAGHAHAVLFHLVDAFHFAFDEDGIFHREDRRQLAVRLVLFDLSDRSCLTHDVAVLRHRFLKKRLCGLIIIVIPYACGVVALRRFARGDPDGKALCEASACRQLIERDMAGPAAEIGSVRDAFDDRVAMQIDDLEWFHD